MVMLPVWREEFTVRPSEVEANGRLSLPGLARLFQDMAGNHAENLEFSIDKLAELGVTWVLARMRFAIRRLPVWKEKVVVETWPTDFDELRAFREFLLLDSEGRPLAAATSLWMVIDRTSRRPVPLPELIRRIPFPDRPRVEAGDLRHLPRLAAAEHQAAVKVRWADIDLNQHANNVSYLEWALTPLPIARRAGSPPSEIAIDFRAEALLDDELLAAVGRVPDSTGREVWLHRLTRESDGREVALARTVWPL